MLVIGKVPSAFIPCQFKAERERFIVDRRGVECRGAHITLIIRQFLAVNGVVTLDHPPYSPDLALADFFLFPRLKSALKGKKFTYVTDVQSNVTAELKAIPKVLFYRSSQDLYSRSSQCINILGDYFEGQ
ncbi:uncharacterized protein TNCV_2476581 [Trichonephila clavipes]|nr:uncharacterized protein TNCV_2476581 [Trichonephila clavipes]